MYSQNVSGARSKIYKFNDFLANTNFDIIAIQESWFDESIDSNEIIASVDFQISRMDRSCFDNDRSKGGGVCLLVRNQINYVEIVNPVKTRIEMQTIRITSFDHPLIILNVYIPRYSAHITMLNELAKFVRYIKRSFPHPELIIVGDFNLPEINWVPANGGYMLTQVWKK